MKVLLVSAALALTLCAAVPAPAPAPAHSPTHAAPAAKTTPAAPEGWRPSGRLILLPARLEAPAEPAQTDEPKSRVLDSGEYYVLLEDGRLQSVRYTTAALADADKAADKPADKPADKAADKAAKQQAAAPFAQFQVEYFQFPGQPRPLPQPQAEQQAVQQAEQQRQQPLADFEANLQYRDVKPISAPVYAYNSAPLARILKK